MRNIFRTAFIFVLMLGLTTGIYSNGLNLNGVGTKAISMGGAFIGIADDFSAIFWNPAGLTQMENASISAFSSFIMPTGTYTYAPAGIDMETEKETHPAPALGYFKPVSEKLVVGLAAYAISGAGASWDGSKLVPFNTYAGYGDFTAYTWSSKVAALAFSPVAAYKVSDKLSLGASLNVVYGMLDFEKEALGGQYTENLTGTGFGATFGAMFKPSEKFSVGFTFKTPIKLTLKGDVDMPGLAAVPGMPVSSAATREITWPMWAGAGIAFRPNEKLTISFDVQYTNWAKLQEIGMEYDQAYWKINMGAGSVEDNSSFHLNWDDAVQYRVGFEYKISDSFALRGGYYSDPSPAPDTTLMILLPQINYNAVSLGVGYKTEKIVVDFGLEYLSGTDRDADMTGVMAGTAMPGTHGMSILVPTFSFTLFFN
ncbi:MAG: outer membrane protein transport protein [Acidobacteriota bacterium]